MNEARIIEEAASRYGLTDPSPDDVIGAHFPLYNHDRTHTQGYHRIYEAVMRRVLAAKERPRVLCKTCGDPVAAGRNRRYCSEKCRYIGAGGRTHVSRPFEGEIRRQILELYAQGHAMNAVATILGRGQDRVRVTIQQAGMSRATGRPRKERAA